MPIYDSLKLIHIHIPKTGGIFLRLYLKTIEPIEMSELTLDGTSQDGTINFAHSTAKMIREIHPEKWNNYSKFAFVRNPYDRLLSEYLYQCNVKKWKEAEGQKHRTLFYHERTRDFNEFVHNLYQIYLNKDVFNALTHFEKCHFIKQREFLEPQGIRIYHYEDWYHSIKDFCRNMQIPEPPDLNYKINETSHGHYSNYYTSELKSLVISMYGDDFANFGYDREI